jgi:hypothetical protein
MPFVIPRMPFVTSILGDHLNDGNRSMNRSCLNDGARITAGSYGNGRIDSSPGRVAPSGAPILSIHNFKVFWAVEERSPRPHGANPAASV